MLLNDLDLEDLIDIGIRFLSPIFAKRVTASFLSMSGAGGPSSGHYLMDNLDSQQPFKKRNCFLLRKPNGVIHEIRRNIIIIFNYFFNYFFSNRLHLLF